MLRFSALFAACLSLAWSMACGPRAFAASQRPLATEQAQDTGFLNRKVELHGVTHRFQVYLPEDWRRDDHKLWPIILFLHGRGERGSEGMWQTQIGLPEEIRDHPERWPFIIVMPQCPVPEYWTDPDMLTLAMAALDQESAEFHGDPDRTYLSGLSLGGYGAWELARLHPHRWAAIAIAAGGIFWSYAPERWQESSTLPAEYAAALGHTPVWLFHGVDDPVVPSRESELMFDAFKAAGGHIRLWLYEGVKHDCWQRAYNEPDLPRWLLSHRLEPRPATEESSAPEPPPVAERVLVPLQPATMKLTQAQLDTLTGEYHDHNGHPIMTVYRLADDLYVKNQLGEIDELGAESPFVFFYLNGSGTTTLTFQHDSRGRVLALLLHDDRHEERWEKRIQIPSRPVASNSLR